MIKYPNSMITNITEHVMATNKTRIIVEMETETLNSTLQLPHVYKVTTEANVQAKILKAVQVGLNVERMRVFLLLLNLRCGNSIKRF